MTPNEMGWFMMSLIKDSKPAVKPVKKKRPVKEKSAGEEVMGIIIGIVTLIIMSWILF